MLLATKLHIPRLHSGLVPRPRLQRRLDTGLAGRLILLSAPPGFGKTTLLAQWLAGGRAQDGDPPAVAWLSLDESDNDPARFFAYFAAAVHNRCATGADAGQAQTYPLGSDYELLMADLINAITDRSRPQLLVLDDYHVLRTPPIDRALAYFIEHMPPHMHVTISTRADPALPLARWRARRDLAEIREADLRFSEEESRQFLLDIMGMQMEPQDVATLERRTEGWIAGLQLAALSMQGRSDISHQVQRFAGAHAYIVDYLTEEALRRQPDEILQFLLATSILPRMCASLCDAVTGRSDGQAMLDYLARIHLFVIPLDDERTWFRYHQLFAEMLRNRLAQEPPDRLADLHCRAARWHAAARAMMEAIEHALSGDADLAVDYIVQARQPFQQRGEYATLIGWLSRLPDAAYEERCDLCLLRAKTHMFLHELDAAQTWLARTEHVVRKQPENCSARTLLADVVVVRCDIALNRCDLDEAAALAAHALELIPDTRAASRAEALMLQGVTHFWRSELAPARAAWREAAALAQAAGDMRVVVYARGNLARIYYEQGQLQSAADELHAVRQFAARQGLEDLPLFAGWHLAMANVLLEWNRIAEAAQHVATALGLARQARNVRTLLHGHLHLMRVLEAQNQWPQAAEALAHAQQLARAHDLPPYMVEEMRREEVMVALHEHNTARLDAWLAAAPGPGDPMVAGLEFRHLLTARVAADRREYAQAGQLLDRVCHVAQERMLWRLALETQTLKAITLFAVGCRSEALEVLESALRRAAPAGFVQIFVREGEPLRRLLAELRPRLADDALAAYVSSLLAAFSGDTLPAPAASPAVHSSQEALTARELEVLRLVEQGLSDRQIAEQLVVVIGTVKRHLSNIYDKLHAHSRTQALSRARQLGWL